MREEGGGRGRRGWEWSECGGMGGLDVGRSGHLLCPPSYVEGWGRRWATAAHEHCAPGRGVRAGGGPSGVPGRHGSPAGAVPAAPPSAPATTRSGDTASAAGPREMAAWHCPQRRPLQRNGCLALPAAPPSARAIAGDKVDRQAKRSE